MKTSSIEIMAGLLTRNLLQRRVGRLRCELLGGLGGLGGLAKILGRFERFETATTPPSGGLENNVEVRKRLSALRYVKKHLANLAEQKHAKITWHTTRKQWNLPGFFMIYVVCQLAHHADCLAQHERTMRKQ